MVVIAKMMIKQGLTLLTYLYFRLLLRLLYRVQWLRGGASYSRLTGPGFESCAVVSKPWASFFNLHCFSSLRRVNEYLAIDGGYGCVQAAFTH